MDEHVYPCICAGSMAKPCSILFGLCFFFAVNESQQDRVTDSISVVVKKVIRHFSHRRQMSEEGQI